MPEQHIPPGFRQVRPGLYERIQSHCEACGHPIHNGRCNWPESHPTLGKWDCGCTTDQE